MEKKFNFGIAWFYEEDWEEWKKISDDEMEEDYEDWLISAESSISGLEEIFGSVQKVYIRPKEFKDWCKKNHRKLDSTARSEYISVVLQNRARNK